MTSASGKSHEKSASQRSERSVRSSAHVTNERQAILALQATAGNRAVAGLLGRGHGKPLDPTTRVEMEAKFGEDFGDVRVHTDRAAASAAAALGANAWTSGRDIVFGEGFFSPGTRKGKKLLAHELAHVVQQRRGGSRPRTFEPDSVAERDAANAAGQIAGPGPVSVGAATGTGVARDEAEEPWWKKRLNPIYQRALEVLPKGVADELEQANEAAKNFVKTTGVSDQDLNQAVKIADPVIQPVADFLGPKSDAQPAPAADESKPVTWLGAPPIDVQLKQLREQRAAQAALDRDDPGALAPPVQNKGVSDLPPLDVMLRPDPAPTEFESKLQSGKPFQIKIHPKPEIDPRNAMWLGERPTDEQMKNMRFEDPNDPARRVWVDDNKEVEVQVDNDSTMPIRDPKTNELRGYRVRDPRHSETLLVLDRNGEVQGSRGTERPLERPAVDPIDAAMIAADLGPLAAKGLQAGGKAVLAAIAKSGAREVGEAGGDEASKLLARQASEALESGLSHPRDFPELNLGASPANDTELAGQASEALEKGVSHPRDFPELDLGAGPANDVEPLDAPARNALPDEDVIHLDDYRAQGVEQAQQDLLQVAEGQDFAADRTVASASRSGAGGGPLVGVPNQAVAQASQDVAVRAATGGSAGKAAAGPNLVRFGKDEVDHLTGMWEERLAAEQDPARRAEIRRYIEVLENKGRPLGRGSQSEDELTQYFEGQAQKRFEIQGPGGENTTTIPDVDAPNARIEMKNWEMVNIPSPNLGQKMLNDLAKQVAARRLIRPFKPQKLVLDLRGQALSPSQIEQIGKTFADTTKLPPGNIYIVTW